MAGQIRLALSVSGPQGALASGGLRPAHRGVPHGHVRLRVTDEHHKAMMLAATSGKTDSSLKESQKNAYDPTSLRLVETSKHL